MPPSGINQLRRPAHKLFHFKAQHRERSEVSSNTIEVYVHHLRNKLGKDFIRTIRGLGYRLGQLQG